MLEFLAICAVGELFWIGWDLQKIVSRLSGGHEDGFNDLRGELEMIRKELWKLRHHEQDER